MRGALRKFTPKTHNFCIKNIILLQKRHNKEDKKEPLAYLRAYLRAYFRLILITNGAVKRSPFSAIDVFLHFLPINQAFLRFLRALFSYFCDFRALFFPIHRIIVRLPYLSSLFLGLRPTACAFFVFCPFTCFLCYFSIRHL